MVYFSYKKLWESQFDNIVPERDKIQDIKINQIKLKVNDTYMNDEKLTTTFEHTDDSDVIKKAFLDVKSSIIDGHLSLLEKHYNEFKLHNKENLLIERAVTTTMQIFYDKGLFDNYDKADQLLKDYLIVEVNDRRRFNLEQNKCCHS